MIEWVERDALMERGAARIKPADVVLDIAPGIRPQVFIKPKVLIGIDAHEEYIRILRDRFEGNNVILINGKVPGCLQYLPSRSVDTIFMLDFIEHLTKADGEATIKECERIARKQIVLFTPLGFMHQEEEGATDGWALKGVHWQAHRSGWTPEDFDESWHCLACKAFHMVNGKGEPFDPPFGAFWAFKDLAASGEVETELAPFDVSAAGLIHREQVVLSQEIGMRRREARIQKAEYFFENSRIVRTLRWIQRLFGRKQFPMLKDFDAAKPEEKK